MSTIYNWKTYYTLDEAKIISDANIEKSANRLIEDLESKIRFLTDIKFYK